MGEEIEDYYENHYDRLDEAAIEGMHEVFDEVVSENEEEDDLSDNEGGGKESKGRGGKKSKNVGKKSKKTEKKGKIGGSKNKVLFRLKKFKDVTE